MHGVRAPGRIVMVVQEGSCWVRLQDSTRKNLTAKSVVIWEPGELVEHGSIAGEGYKTESYWRRAGRGRDQRWHRRRRAWDDAGRSGTGPADTLQLLRQETKPVAAMATAAAETGGDVSRPAVVCTECLTLCNEIFSEELA
jgi:hypothetical protein